MFRASLGSFSTWGILAAAAALLLAQPVSSTPNQQRTSTVPDQLLQRMQMLEARVQTLEARVQSQQAQIDAQERARYSPTSTVDASGWLAPAAQTATAAQSPQANCKQPFYIDKEGIRRLMPECASEEHASACVPPYALAPDGIKHLNAKCLATVKNEPCDAPFFVNDEGVKQYRRECL